MGARERETGSRGRILVVDDSALVRRILVATLEHNGYRVAQATNGVEALERLLAEPFDVSLTDLNMPGGGGLDLLAALGKTSVSTEMLVLTSGDAADVQRALVDRDLPACELLDKAPANSKAILEAVERAVERKALRAAPPPIAVTRTANEWEIAL